MSEYQNRIRRQIRLSRLEIVSELYKRGYSYPKIKDEVMKRLGISTYSLQTVHRDVQFLLKEWRENRINDTDQAIQLELERIDDAVRELWGQWEKSKQDYTKTSNKRKGAPVADKKSGASTIKTFQKEETETEVIRLGDVSYLAEIRAQLAERRKLLGLYAPEKKDVVVNEFDFDTAILSDEEKALLLELARKQK